MHFRSSRHPDLSLLGVLRVLPTACVANPGQAFSRPFNLVCHYCATCWCAINTISSRPPCRRLLRLAKASAISCSLEPHRRLIHVISGAGLVGRLSCGVDRNPQLCRRLCSSMTSSNHDAKMTNWPRPPGRERTGNEQKLLSRGH